MPHHRRRHNKDPDDEPLPQRVEESHAEPYSRLPNDFRQTPNYRRTDSTSSNSGRTSYDMSRASSSRTPRDSTWRPKDTERSYTDDYYRERREEYDVANSREPESWPSRSVPEPRFSEREWSQGYDAGYSTSSYPEQSTWGIPSNTPVDHRNGHQERWHSQNPRGHAFKGRPPERTQTVEQRRDWQNRPSRGHTYVDPWNPPPPDNKPVLDNRSWEPAPTWQPSGSGERQNHRNQNGSRSDYYNKPSSIGRRGASSNNNATHRNHNYTQSKPQRDWRNDDGNANNKPQRDWRSDDGNANTKPQRDWRNDDGIANTKPQRDWRNDDGIANTKPQRDWRNDDVNPNNWSRRESQGSERAPLPSPSARKHPRSPTRSRSGSRSPAESYYSRRSSRARTRSPSASPASKRRRRESSPIAVTGRPSHEGGHAVWVPRQGQPLPSASESTHKQNNLPVRRRNASPTSSMSTGRSPSRSRSPIPELSPSFHRLSTAVSAPAIISSPRTAVDGVSGDARQNGNDAVNGAHNKRGLRTQPLAQNASIDIMPPPTIIPAVHTSRPVPELPRPSLSKPMAPTRMIAKNSGFKPIGQSSLSLRKFFPGDEEDMDISSDMSVVADAEQELLSQSTTDPSLAHPPTEKPMPAHSTSDPIVDDPPLPRLPSSPLAPSPRSSIVMEEESSLSAEPRLPSPPLQTPRQPDLDMNDNTGASTPSIQSRSELYAIVSQVGEGTFGKVYKAQNTVTKRYVALKRIRMESEKEGFPVTAMREIKLLQSLRHENVVRLYEMMVSNGSVYMVFEYMDHDLTGILSQSQFNFTDAHLKSLSHQMLAGLAYLHHKGVVHRDIKGSNILINNRGELKLADFGLARFYQKRRRTDYTNRVITLWYRPPELLFGATIYGPEVDMWSAGCIMLELFTKKPVFQGSDEIHQLDTIYRVIGTPTPDRWSDVANLPWYELVKPRDEIPNHFRELFRKWMSQAALDLAERLLCYDPAARATAVQAMDAPYFTQEDPPAMAPVGLAILQGEWHELDTKRERAKKRRRNDIAIQ